MSKYKDKIKKLPRVTLDAISEVCRGMLPSEYRSHPWDLPYGDKNFAKIFDQEDQLNGYAAAYTNWHKGKLHIAFDHTPCLLYTSPSPRDPKTSRMPSSA